MAGEAFSEYKFNELELTKELHRGLEKLGFEQMTPIQAEAIPVIMTGRDVIGQAQTGTGKTAAFGLPLLNKIDPDNKKLQAIILCPTRELAMQVCGELRSFATYMQNVKILPIYGGQDIRKQILSLKGVQIVVGTPGRVMDHMRRHTIKMNQVETVVLDEADEMLKMGFREDMEVILDEIDHPHQTCLFSATMPQEILDITNRFQCNPQLVKIAAKELTIERIKQYYYAVKREYKTEAIIRLMAYYGYKKSIIFCNTKAMTEDLAHELSEQGYMAMALNGDLSQAQRDNVMGKFRDGSVTILIATDIAARGIDVDDVEAVFNYDVPTENEYYVHRIGRTGRAGREGVSHTLCRSKDFNKLHEIERVCNCKMEEATVPSSKVVENAKEKKVLAEVMEILASGKSGNYIPVIKEYCEENFITPEMLAAAFLRMEMGEQTSEIEVSLPSKPERKRGRKSDKYDDEKFENFRGKKSDRNNAKKDNRGKRHSDERRNADKHALAVTKEDRKKMKKKNKEVAERELFKAYQEVEKYERFEKKGKKRK